MIISTNWLADYVQLQAPTDLLVERLLMSGLNHESTRLVGSDTAIEIEVTSNRPDCLGHIGVAREAAVLFARPLHFPDPQPLQQGGDVASSVAVEILAADLCPFYSARVIRGVRVGPSPAWLIERLQTVGIVSINNIVDITNYVMLECGQPLHVFDLGTIRGGRLIVRRALAGESFTAINHKTYVLSDQICVIADAQRPLALAGVMGGADSEITANTVDIVIESAQFAPLAVRAAARGLILASASSYRFERGPDPAAVDWASRRVAAMVLASAGGTLDRGVCTAGTLASHPATIELRFGRVAEVLGIDVAAPRQQEILLSLGFVEQWSSPEASQWQAPTWRRDVSREIDLVEEIARIEGYDKVPEDTPIAARPVELSRHEKTIRRASEVLVSAGFCEAMTRSVVNEAMETTQSPWNHAGSTDQARATKSFAETGPLSVSPALVRGADRLRRTLLPSLLEARAGNMSVGAPHGDLFEIARAYLPGSTPHAPIEEPLLLSLVTEGDFSVAKGLAEAVLAGLGLPSEADRCRGANRITFRRLFLDLFAPGQAAEIVLHAVDCEPERIGVVGIIASGIAGRFGLASAVGAMELRLDRLEFAVGVERSLHKPSEFPAIQRDINLVVDATVPWGNIAEAIRSGAGDLLEECRLLQIWQDAERLGKDKKSVVVSLRLRSTVGTLSSDEANRMVDAIVVACGRQVHATLRSA